MGARWLAGRDRRQGENIAPLLLPAFSDLKVFANELSTYIPVLCPAPEQRDRRLRVDVVDDACQVHVVVANLVVVQVDPTGRL